MKRFIFRRGFSTIEVLMVVLIIALLTSLTLGYSREGEKQIVLATARASLLETIIQSKNLAFQTFKQIRYLCGYGVHFENNQYILFTDLPTGNPLNQRCPMPTASGPFYSGATENFRVESLDPRLEILVCFVPQGITSLGLALPSILCPGTNVADVLFMPPDPIVLFDPPLPGSDMVIVLRFRDGSSSSRIIVGRAGQVSVQ